MTLTRVGQANFYEGHTQHRQAFFASYWQPVFLPISDLRHGIILAIARYGPGTSFDPHPHPSRTAHTGHR